MPTNTALLDHLLTRRSVSPAFLVDPGPSSDELEQMLTVATRVPDHGKLAPWRLVVFEGPARVAVGEKLAQLIAQRDPAADAARLEIERRQFLPAPLIVGVVSTAGPHPKIPEVEQLLSAGNVAFNLEHAAYAFGYAAQWVSRWYTYDAEASALLGARPGERFVGFIHIGTPTTTMDERSRPALTDVVTRWGG